MDGTGSLGVIGPEVQNALWIWISRILKWDSIGLNGKLRKGGCEEMIIDHELKERKEYLFRTY